MVVSSPEGRATECGSGGQAGMSVSCRLDNEGRRRTLEVGF